MLRQSDLPRYKVQIDRLENNEAVATFIEDSSWGNYHKSDDVYNLIDKAESEIKGLNDEIADLCNTLDEYKSPSYFSSFMWGASTCFLLVILIGGMFSG